MKKLLTIAALLFTMTCHSQTKTYSVQPKVILGSDTAKFVRVTVDTYPFTGGTRITMDVLLFQGKKQTNSVHTSVLYGRNDFATYPPTEAEIKAKVEAEKGIVIIN